MTTPTPADLPDPAVLNRLAELYRLEQQGDRALLAVGPWSAYSLIGALQLCTRHPDLGAGLRTTLEQIAHTLADGWFKDDPLLYPVLQRGFDPDQDPTLEATGFRCRCPRCQMVSHNPHDKAHGYCGNCHDFTAKPPPPRERTTPRDRDLHA